jgi:hypothetical protein
MADTLRKIARELRDFLRWIIHAIGGSIRKVEGWTLGGIFKGLGIAALVLLALTAVAILVLIEYPKTQIPAYEPVNQIVYLDQGWGATRQASLRQVFNYTPQGTTLKGLRYRWFQHLELPWSSRRFADPDHMRSYGFLVDLAPTPMNPDLMPVGFTNRHDETVNDDLLDITCAACHTGQINVLKDGQRIGIRIEGGPAMHAFTAMKPGHFLPMLVSSLANTYLNPFKFERFAKNVLGDEYYKGGKSQLRTDLRMVLGAFAGQAWTDWSRHLYPVEEGFGRTDALGRISNTVFAENLDEKNYLPGNAPVSFPPVWEIWKFDWVQYNGSVKQPLARNIGEAMGVGAVYHLIDPYGRPIQPAARYTTTAHIENLAAIEGALRQLQPPEWAEDLLGKIDWCKARRGRTTFQNVCQKCHGPFAADLWQTAWNAPGKVGCKPSDRHCVPDASKAQPEWIMKLLSVEDIGTDPVTAMNFVTRRLDLSKAGLPAKDLREALYPMLAEESARKKQFYYWEIAALEKKNPKTPEDGSRLAYYRKELADEEANGEARIRRDLDQIDLKSVSAGAGLSYLGVLIRDKYYRDHGISPDRQADIEGYGALDLPQVIPAYKARPLAGAWATAPYLHNGSVPNLYSLLLPVGERPKKFYVGRRDFDPVMLGYRLEPMSRGGFWFDTSIAGNHNTGHEFRKGYVAPARESYGGGWSQNTQPRYGVIGDEFTDAERWDIIEYLKVHTDTEDVTRKHDREIAACPGSVSRP